jgi:hypothetical protein
MDSSVERRVCRSDSPGLALQYQIEHSRRQSRLRALVLTDQHGLPVATSGDEALCLELAAAAPWMHPAPGGPVPAGFQGQDVMVRSFHVGEIELHLAALGDVSGCDEELARSLLGVTRILSRA